MILRFLAAVLSISTTLAYAAYAGNINGEAVYVSFSVPGAFGTYPMSINASMSVAGYYYVTPTNTRAFVREADGDLTTFAIGGASWTEPESMNAAGDIVGFYQGNGPETGGFLREADGKITLFPGSASYPAYGIMPISIDDYGDIAGNFVGQNAYPYILSRAGVLTLLADQGNIVATNINESGAVVGFFDNGVIGGGFISHPERYLSAFAVSSDPGCSDETIPDAINTAGTIAGWYTNNYYASPGCGTQNTGGFVLSPDGQLTLFQPPGTMAEFFAHLPEAGYVPLPHWISINEAGDITGFYADTSNVRHGFVRNPYGTITSFDPPEGNQTNPTSINKGGAIAGYYTYKSGGAPVGFIRVPQ